MASGCIGQIYVTEAKNAQYVASMSFVREAHSIAGILMRMSRACALKEYYFNDNRPNQEEKQCS